MLKRIEFLYLKALEYLMVLCVLNLILLLI